MIPKTTEKQKQKQYVADYSGATIYDMHLNTLVWSGYVEKSRSNSNQSSRTFNKGKRWKEELISAFIEALIGLDSGSYPAAPAEYDVLEDIFEGFVENMPRPPKG